PAVAARPAGTAPRPVRLEVFPEGAAAVERAVTAQRAERPPPIERDGGGDRAGHHPGPERGRHGHLGRLAPGPEVADLPAALAGLAPQRRVGVLRDRAADRRE